MFVAVRVPTVKRAPSKPMPLILPVLVYATEGWAIVSVLTFIAGVVVTGLITDSDGLTALPGRRHRATPLCGVGMTLGCFEVQARPPALAGWAFAQVYVATIRAIGLPAGLAVQDIDGLPVVRAREAGGADVLLLVPVDEADLGGAFVDPSHGFAP
ncbi:TPA: hypothetical protein ACKP5X_004264 [Stenotrophomonas maltophilia]